MTPLFDFHSDHENDAVVMAKWRSLPWHLPALEWAENCKRVVNLPRGVSSHPVLFISIAGNLYALKWLPAELARTESACLRQAAALRLPCVSLVGIVSLDTGAAVLVTEYLQRSVPYRTLLLSGALAQYRAHVLDAMASLLVQIHLAGFFWGDCSFSNCLYRRDSGMLQAYMVDVEASETLPAPLSPVLRQDDLRRMEENIQADLSELVSEGSLPSDISFYNSASYVRQRYANLWDLITGVGAIRFDNQSSEAAHFHVQEHVRRLNDMGYTLDDIHAAPAGENGLRIKVTVADRSFHRDRLLALTGLNAEEMQARKLLNEIQEVRVTLAQQRQEDVSLEEAAGHWCEHVYRPAMQRLAPLAHQRQMRQDEANPELLADPAELYCQLLEHKWYLSERSQRDVGHTAALDDYLSQYGDGVNDSI